RLPPRCSLRSLDLMTRRLIMAALVSVVAAAMPARAQAPAPFDGNLQRLAGGNGAPPYLPAPWGGEWGAKLAHGGPGREDCGSAQRRSPHAHDCKLQPGLPIIPTNLSHLHSGCRSSDSPLP